jgi:hypothetical protein
MSRIIRKVWSQGKARQLMISIPKDLGISKGDFVEVRKIKEMFR